MSIFKKTTVTTPDTSGVVLDELRFKLAEARDLASYADSLAAAEHSENTAMAAHFATQAVEAKARQEQANIFAATLNTL